MTLRLLGPADGRLTLARGALTLFDYRYEPDIERVNAPRPYFHPIRTLSGTTVTAARPADHEWHTGLAMTWPWLSGENFFGPRTYVDSQGYVPLDNVGVIRHEAWDDVAFDGTSLRAHERLTWATHDGRSWLAEDRAITVRDVDETQRWWALDLEFRLRNTRGAPLVFGSPTTRGRNDAGYGGLFWRGPGSFEGGRLIAANGREGAAVMGTRAAWLACVTDVATLVFVDRPTNPRYPTKWFARSDQYAGVSFGLAYDEEYVLPPGDTLALDYRIVIADGPLAPERISRLSKVVPERPSPTAAPPHKRGLPPHSRTM